MKKSHQNETVPLPGLVIFDAANGQVLAMNDCAAAMCGCSTSGVKGMGFGDLVKLCPHMEEVTLSGVELEGRRLTVAVIRPGRPAGKRG